MISRIEVTGPTGATHSYSAIPLLDNQLVAEEAQLVVTVDGVEFNYVNSSPSPGEYTLNKTTKVLTLGAVLSSGQVLRIVRSTKNDALHVAFTNNAPMGAADINLCLKQLLFLAQERIDDLEELA